MDWKDAHILGYFNDTALALHKDYATKLLTPTNRFTGLPLAKDPAVAFVEIINENGIIQKWLDGGLDRLPAGYAAQLQSRWNDWLVARYTNDAAMLAAWNIINQPLGANLLPNGAFSNALTGWVGEQHDTARATFSRTFDFTNSAPSAQIVVTQAGSASWHIQFNYPGSARHQRPALHGLVLGEVQSGDELRRLGDAGARRLQAWLRAGSHADDQLAAIHEHVPSEHDGQQRARELRRHGFGSWRRSGSPTCASRRAARLGTLPAGAVPGGAHRAEPPFLRQRLRRHERSPQGLAAFPARPRIPLTTT